MSNFSPSSPPDAHASQVQRAEPFDLPVERATDFAMFLLDAEGKVATWNKGAGRILGWEEAEVLGHSTHRFYTFEDQAQGIPERQLRIAREQGKALNERWQMKKDGSRYYASGLDQALREPDGTLRGYSVTFRDLTAQKQREERVAAELARQAHLFETVLSSIVDFAYTFDREGRFTYVNQALLNLWQRDLTDALGKTFAELDYPAALATSLHAQIQSVWDTGQPLRDETPYTSPAGRTGYYEYIFAPVFNTQGAVEAVAGSTRDVTARKQAEEERLQQRAYVAVLQERNRMAQELHDTLTQGFVGIAMQLEAAKELLRSEPEQAEYHLTRAMTVARDSLVEARRSVQALRALPLQDQELPAALAQLIAQATTGTSVVGEFVVQGNVRPLRPAVDEDLWRIGQEAVTNALQHGRASQVRMELLFTSGAVQLRVKDDGQGFDPLAPAPSGHYGVVGMHERAERLGGTLTIRSERGQGTEVLVVIPGSGAGEAK
jgi:PAS domain S-box-containing protein